MRTKQIITSSVSGKLEPTVTPAQDYLAVRLENLVTRKVIKSIHVSYVADTGGTVTSTEVRLGRVKVVTGLAEPSAGSLNLDPFSPDTQLPNASRVLFDQLVYNSRNFEFPEGLIIEPGSTATIIIGASVGEADSSSAPSASLGYLSVVGEEYAPNWGKEPRPR